MVEPLVTRIAIARRQLARARSIERNLRLQRYHGRNARATGEKLAQLYALPELPRRALGLVHAEHVLATRLSVARDAGQSRPELRARMAELRKELRQW